MTRTTARRGRWAAPGRAAAVVLLVAAPGTASAQEDFRAADLDRPIRVQDAFPVKFREWEIELGLRGAAREGGSRVEGSAEIKTGIALNAQAGVEVDASAKDRGDGTAGALGAGGHLLYNFNRETWSWPAFAARFDLETPGAGPAGRETWTASVTGIVTRSFDRLRLHANAGYLAAGDEDGGDLWRGGIAFDYPIGLFSKAVMGDVYVEVPESAGRARLWLEFGTRWQLTNLSVLDLGLATRLDEWERGRANVELVVGLSRVFGIPSLVRVPALGKPRIR